MASTLSYSDFSSNNKVNNSSSKSRKNKTIKKKTKKVEQFLNSMENEDSDNDLADFDNNFKEFPPNPQLTKQPEEKKEDTNNTDAAVSPEAFTKMDTTQSANMNYQCL